MVERKLAVNYRPIAELIPSATNARTHSDAQVAQISASIREFGWTNPVLIDPEGAIIAGHGRVMAARQLGMGEIPCIVLAGLTPAQRRAYMLADNKLALNAGWDDKLLASEILGLQEDEFDLSLVGFSDEEIKRLLALHDAAQGLTDPDAVPEVPTEPVSVLGDLWALGRHRLVCGDSTSADTIEKLMGGQKADLLFTSPPYAQQRDYKNKIDDWAGLMEGVFSIIPCKAGANVLVNLGMVHNAGKINLYWDQWLAFMDTAGWPLAAWYVWDQGHGMPGNWNGRLAPSHEFVFHFCANLSQANKWVDKKPENIKVKKSNKGAFRQKDGTLKPIYSGDAYGQPMKIADSVIRVNRAPSQTAKMGHPATFPVGLCDYIYRSFAKSGDVIYEPFSGAGTSIIACESFGADCRAVEIAPAYVDVAIQRWQQFTGKAATMDGVSFDDIAGSRKQAA